MSWTCTRCVALLVLVLGVSSLSTGAFSADNPYPITKEDKAFLQALKEAIAADQEAWIAARVSYPISVKVEGERRQIENPKDFIVHFSQIINEKVKSAVVKQDSDMLFKNWSGAMIGSGEIWFTAVKPRADRGAQYTIYIVGINN